MTSTTNWPEPWYMYASLRKPVFLLPLQCSLNLQESSPYPILAHSAFFTVYACTIPRSCSIKASKSQPYAS